MKSKYPNYSQGLGTKRIEETLSDEDKNILDEFCSFCRVSASEKRVKEKIRTYMLQIRDLIEKPYDKWTLKDIQGFMILLNDCDKTEWTKNDIKKILRRFLRWKYKKDEDLETMLSLIKCKSDKEAFNQVKVNENTLINLEEFEKMLKSANTLKQKAILSILFETACRPQELRMLKWADVKLDGEIGSVTLYSGKTRKTRTIPIKDSITHIKRYKQEYEYPDVRDDDWIFPTQRDRTQPLSNNALPVMFKRLSKKAGLNRNIFPYLCRHSRITTLSNSLTAQMMSKFAGHSIKQTEMYTHLSSEDLRKAFSKIYNVKEITPDQKNKYDKQIEVMQAQIKFLMENIETLAPGVKQKPKEEIYSF
jgi:integrase